MKRFSRALALFSATALAVLVPAVSTTSGASAAGETPTGYVVTADDGGGCELQQIDLDTGALTDLPAVASPEACATDIAVAPSGTVYGITDDFVLDIGSQDFAPSAINGPSLVTYAADGTPSTMPIDTGGDAFIANGGIAVAADGTVYAQIASQIPGCDTGTTPPTSLGPLYEGDSVCLFTVNPTTGAATLIGTTGLFETEFYALTACASGLRSTYFGDESLVWVTESSTTGAVTDAADADFFPTGYDCQSTGSTLYATTAAQTDNLKSTAAVDASVGTVDFSTGSFTETALLSDPTADVLALGVVPASAPTPPTTPTTEPGPAVAATEVEVAPTFTG